MSAHSHQFDSELNQLSGMRKAPIRHRRLVSITADLQLKIHGRRGKDTVLALRDCCALRRHDDDKDDEDAARFERRFAVAFRGSRSESLLFEADDRQHADAWLQRLDAAVQRAIAEHQQQQQQQAESVVRVHIVGGRDMVAMDRGGTSDPYCSVALGTQLYLTRVIPKTLQPHWDDVFYLRAEPAQCSTALLIVTVMDRDVLSKDDPMGSVALSLQDVADGSERLGVHTLQGVATGTLEIGLQGIGWRSAAPREQPAQPVVAEAAREFIECRVCLDKAINAVLLPCSHSCLCIDCAESMAKRECPLCRAPVESVMKIFIG